MIEAGQMYHKIWSDPLEDKIHITTYQDVEPILQENKALFSEHGGKRAGEDFQWVGQIPNAIIHKWLVEEGINIFDPNHMDAIKKKLNDPGYRFLRTGGGRL